MTRRSPPARRILTGTQRSLLLLLAAGLTVIALASDPGVRLARRSQSVLAWCVLILGAVGTMSLVFYTLVVFHNVSADRHQILYVILYVNIAATVMALLVPTFAALAVPRRFGVCLLAGWITAATAFSLANLTFLEDESLDTTSTAPNPDVLLRRREFSRRRRRPRGRVGTAQPM